MGVMACASVAQAQPVTPAGPSQHRVMPGDTLGTVASTYGGHSRHWHQLQRLNRLANPNHLTPGSLLQLPPEWAATPAVFVDVVFVNGQAFMTPPEGSREPLAPGMRPTVGSVIEVGAESTVHLRLSDGSLMQLTPSTRLRLDRLRRLDSGATDVHWSLEEGRVENRVSTPAINGRRFEIRTPYAVASVRGTEFAVTVAPGQVARSEVLSGTVELRPPRGASLKLTGGLGAPARKRGVGPIMRLPAAPALSPLADQVVSGPRMSLPLPTPRSGTSWRVRVAPAQSPEQVLRDVGTADPGVEFAALEPGEYTVWLQTQDAEGFLSPPTRSSWTVRPLPPPPLYIRPEGNTTLTGPQVELLCSQPEHATAFHLQVSSVPDFSTLLHDLPTLPQCQFTTQLEPGTYHWRAATITHDAAGQPVKGVFSEGSRFEVRPPPPGAPAAATDVQDDVLQLHWDSRPGWNYRVQVASDASFNQPLINQHTALSRLSLPNWPAGRYFVRVQATDPWGQNSPFSPVQSVRVERSWSSGSGLVWRSSDGLRVLGAQTP